MAINRQKRAFTAQFKLEALDFAERNSVEGAAREFKVDPKTIRDWRERKRDLQEQASTVEGSKKLRLEGAGTKVVSVELEKRLVQWICELRSQGIDVSRRMIMDEGRKLFPTVQDKTTNSFVASRGWLENFLSRNQLKLGRSRIKAERKDSSAVNDSEKKIDV